MRWDAEKYDAVRAPQIDAGRKLIANAKVRDTDSILDIGCGTGKLTVELANLASRGRVIGIDPSKEMLERARKVSVGIKNINLMQIAAQSMNFSNTFDLAFSSSALQWVKEQEKVIELVYKSLKKGGRIAFQLPAKYFCREFFDYTRNVIILLGLEQFYTEWQSPWYFPIKGKYEALLKDIGFGNIIVFYKDYTISSIPTPSGAQRRWSCGC